MAFVSDSIIPRRLFLDTGTFQAIADCGGYVFGEDPLPHADDFPSDAVPQILRRSDGEDILDSLREIFTFNDRAHFDWILSSSSLAEIDAAKNVRLSRYARDIIQHSEICLTENPPRRFATTMASFFQGSVFGNLSSKDRNLLLDAAASDRDHFLTIEKRLPKQAHVILKYVPLVICSPSELWTKPVPHLSGL
ncbi:hypothetical protein [Ancylobacter amanitiformis]|uniref:PIN domain-containing protein n=1 Tax=Ancylobacter amanitiformis TaxID=217069 RepID=A0ABU0LRD2_9HYPH|nr:hypothetical protein [Ancylobacter amanitiformis]MDQ0511215.1 hypothetical protein [Ancylobacter amanitiformis]